MPISLISGMRQALTLVVSVTCLLISQASFAAYSQIVSFGDSLSDTGNIFTSTGGAYPAAPYFDGNFSNGDIWIENLASSLGVAAPTASLVGGTNYAWGGARTTEAGGAGQPSAQTQVAQYFAATAGIADPNALYTIMIGGNDVNAYDGVGYGGAELAADGQVAATLAANLLAAGAQSILILNVPDVGTAPIADGFEAAVTGLTSLYNGNLAAALGALGSSNVALVDIFAVTQDIAANPGTYGFTNVDDPCLDVGAGTLCANPDDYAFWDELHPTAAGHQIIADASLSAALALQPVPVPAGLPLMLSALAGLMIAKRKQVAA